MPTLEGRALGFGLTLTAAQILDPAAPELPPDDARGRLFVAVDPALAARLARGDVIVAEEIADPDGAAPRALAALAQAGVVALVARRFAATVRESAAAVGVVPVVVDTPCMLRTGDRLRLDLDAGKVVDLSSGDRVAIRNASTSTERATLRAILARSVR
ncbi:MAG: hypothetical protein IT294_14405 [Deltaproteobacteria bacterium]|nr:hypothetical protein [Deltaproteobacteria bacterium]